jgi:hypothetical protein
MSGYNLTLTNGTALLTLADGPTSLDTTTTSLSLVGKNYAAGYGLYLNQNFIKLMEHFSNPTAPSSPLKGQLWWDSINKHLSVYTGAEWKVISSSQTGATAPPNPVAGDFWWNSVSSQLSVYSGTSWILVGPISSPSSALTAIIPDTGTDSGASPHYVGNVVVNNKLSAIFSTDTISYTPSPAITGLSSVIPGLNLVAGLNVGGNITAGNTTTTTQYGNAIGTTATYSGNVTAGNIIVTTSYSNAVGTTATYSGNVTAGNLSTGKVTATSATFSGNVSFTGNVTLPPAATIDLTSIAQSVIPTANLTYNLGSTTKWWNNIYGTAVHAQYADLAERFEADTEYTPGTVVELGGPAEITAVGVDLSEDVFGVISTNAAYLMNSGAGSNTTHPPVAVQGRVPVRVTGTICKGDRLVSAGNGVARAGKRSEITAWNVIGRALENKTTPGLGVVEAVVKLNS